MRIIIEGADGTGKTTLAKQLAEKYNLDVIHMTNRDSNTFGFYKESIGKQDVVWDRNMIGEVIYPSIFGRKANIDDDDLLYLIHKARNAGVIFLILTCDDRVIRKRLAQRGNEYDFIVSNIGIINKAFCDIASAFRLPLIDTSKVSFEDICKDYID